MGKNLKEMAVLKDHLVKHQLKLTRQRQHILDAFLKTEHVTAEQMYRQLAKRDPRIGLAEWPRERSDSVRQTSP